MLTQSYFYFYLVSNSVKIFIKSLQNLSSIHRAIMLWDKVLIADEAIENYKVLEFDRVIIKMIFERRIMWIGVI